jgi:hypothetical protein
MMGSFFFPGLVVKPGKYGLIGLLNAGVRYVRTCNKTTREMMTRCNIPCMRYERQIKGSSSKASCQETERCCTAEGRAPHTLPQQHATVNNQNNGQNN